MKFNSIKSRFMIYIGLLIAVICIGLGGLLYYYSSASLLNEIEVRLLDRAGDTGELVRSRLDTRLSELEAIASRNDIKSMDWEQIKPVLKEEINRTEYATI